MRVRFKVDKNKVLTEVERLTAYFGQRKQSDDEGTFERISTTESDREMLEPFWKAACAAASDKLKRFARRIENDVEGSHQHYDVVMEMSSLYDTELNESIEDSLQNFFINLIASKWLGIVSPDDAAQFAAESVAYMQDVERKVYYRKRPQRVSIKDKRDGLPQVHFTPSGDAPILREPVVRRY